MIAIREDAAGGIKVSGIHAETCGSEEEMFRCLSDGSVQRTTGATLMNEQSSRCQGAFGALELAELLGAEYIFWGDLFGCYLEFGRSFVFSGGRCLTFGIIWVHVWGRRAGEVAFHFHAHPGTAKPEVRLC